MSDDKKKPVGGPDVKAAQPNMPGASEGKVAGIDAVAIAELSQPGGIRTLLTEIVQQMLPATIAANRALAGPPPAGPTPARNLGPICPTCRLRVSACGGEHVKMVVYPQKDPEHNGPFFPGAILNGVVFLSNNQDHYIDVPAKCQGHIQRIIVDFETNEAEMARGRKKRHHSGHMVRRADGSVAASNPPMGWR